MWFRCGHFDNRPGASFKPNVVVAIDSSSTSRKISFAGSAAVAGKSEKKTRRRMYSFRFFLPPPMTVKEETSDGLRATPDQAPTMRQREETNIEPQLNHRPPTEQEEPNSQLRLDILGLGIRTPGEEEEVLSLFQETVWKVEACLQKLLGSMLC